MSLPLHQAEQRTAAEQKENAGADPFPEIPGAEILLFLLQIPQHPIGEQKGFPDRPPKPAEVGCFGHDFLRVCPLALYR